MACTISHSCSICKEVNEKQRVPHCQHCAACLADSGTRSNSGRPTPQPRLATWCTKCFTPEQIASRLCERCAGKQESLDAVGKNCVRCKTTTDLADKASICSTGGCKAQLRLCEACLSIPYGKNYCSKCAYEKKSNCHHCEVSSVLVDTTFVCSESECKARSKLCPRCVCLGSRPQDTKCKSCYNKDDLCIRCGLSKARPHLNCLRCCWGCTTMFFLQGVCCASASRCGHSELQDVQQLSSLVPEALRRSEAARVAIRLVS